MLGKKPTRQNRYKKKTKAQRHRLMQRLLGGLKLMVLMAVLLSASALFMVGYAAVTQSDYFRTKTIVVKGHERLTREAILAHAQLQPGDNLLAVNLGLVRKRLLAQPWIASVHVVREIPEQITITLKEHTPLAVVDLGRQFLLNRKGRIFKELKPEDPQNLPLVTGIDYTDISLGNDALTPVMDAVVQALELSRSKSSAVPFQEIKAVHMDQEMGISLTVGKEQRIVKMGFRDYQAKYRRLNQLLPHLKGNRKWREFITIDVNNPNRVVVKLGSPSMKGT